ncbi:hypothetical protein [Paraburkholderia sediminicola]|uniref:hypothetical protein n=1 Tax=Paraburkholderia sediminicola TaxID=458836 RepID=UPI0038B7F60C
MKTQRHAMNSPQTIQVGRDEKAPFVAFGDDSQYGDSLAFAFVLVPRTRLRFAERKLERLKKRFKIPQHVTLHCRTLFSGQQREKSGLGHLSPSDVRSIAAQAITIINDVNARVHFAVQDATTFFASLGNELQLYNQDGSPSVKLPVTPDPKGLLGMMAFSCFPLNQNGRYGPTASQCEIYVSEDKTKVGFIGEKRTRADSHYAGFLDIGNACVQLNANIVAADAIPLLQLADIASYICSHAFSKTGDVQFWKDQCARITNWFRVG